MKLPLRILCVVVSFLLLGYSSLYGQTSNIKRISPLPKIIEKNFHISTSGHWVPSLSEEIIKMSSDANFNVVHAYFSDKKVEEVMSLAKKYDVMIMLGDWKFNLKNERRFKPGQPDFEKNMKASLDQLVKYPNFYGFNYLDEPNSRSFPEIALFQKFMVQHYPEIVAYMNLLPNFATKKELGNETYRE